MKKGTDTALREQTEGAAPDETTTPQDGNAAATTELSDSELQTAAGGDIGAWVDWARDWYDYFTS